MVDFVKALRRPFSDTNKLLIGTLLGMIPVVNFVVRGYALVSTGLTKEKVKRNILPEWKNYGDLFMKGFVSIVIGFLLFLPAAIAFLGTFGTVVMSPVVNMMFGGMSSDTWNNLMTGQITEIQIEQWFTQNWTQLIPVLMSALPFLILGAFLALLAFYILPIAVLEWLKEDRVGAAFSWKVLGKAAKMDYLVNWIIVTFLSGIVMVLVSWIPFVGLGISTYIVGVFSYTVFAEIYEKL
jgi:hypothetical protein